MKKILPLLLALAMMISVIAVAPISASAVSTITVGDCEYTIEDSKATLTQYSGSETSLTIPTTVKGYPVVGVGYQAFMKNATIKYLTIPDGMTIEKNAFRKCTKLESISIGNNCVVGYAAFKGDTALISVGIGDKCHFDGDCFDGCSKLEAVVIGDDAHIEGWTFAYCDSLKYFTIGREATMEFDIFYGSTNITDMSFVSDSTYHFFGDVYGHYPSTFTQTKWYENKSNGMIYVGKTAFAYKGEGSGGAVVKKGTKNIAPYAYLDTRFTSVTIPDSVTEIGHHAFYYCEAEDINIPSSVTRISYGAFMSSSVKDITIPSGVTCIEESAFYDSELESIEIPDTVTEIGYKAFCYSDLKTIDFPESVTKIGVDTITDTPLWTKNPDGAIYIGDALVGYKGKWPTSFSVKSGTRIICDQLFLDIRDENYGEEGTELHTEVSTVTIPKSVKYIGDHAFGYSWTSYSGDEDDFADYDALDLTVKGYKGTAAEKYAALEDSFKFVALTEKLSAPVISKASNTINGVKLTWNKVDGCNKYRVYSQLKGSSIKDLLEETADNSYLDYSAESGNTYTYYVCCLDDKADKEISSLSKGVTKTFYDVPVVRGVTNTTTGVKITLDESDGAKNYRIFRKTSSTDWKKLADTASLTYTDTTAKSGTTYYYSAAVISSSGTQLTPHHSTGVSKKFVATPKISEVKLNADSVSVSWKKVTGAAKYRVFRKTSKTGTWKKMYDTTKLTYTNTSVESGKTYYYTVVALNSNGNQVSGKYNTGESIKFISAPKNPTLSNTKSGVKATWTSVTGAAKYRVYRKTASGSWKKLYDTTKLTYTDTTAKSGTTYYYAVRCISKDGSSLTSARRSGTKITCKK